MLDASSSSGAPVELGSHQFWPSVRPDECNNSIMAGVVMHSTLLYYTSLCYTILWCNMLPYTAANLHFTSLWHNVFTHYYTTVCYLKLEIPKLLLTKVR